MRVLITGVTGFIGSQIADKLAKTGKFEVYGIVRHLSTARRVNKDIKTVTADLTDRQSIERAVKLIRPDIVVHVGALTPVSLSYEMPTIYAETNYFGTIYLAEACRKYAENLKSFIYASTSEVYGQQNDFPLYENLPAYPNTPYAISKYAGELYVRKYMVEAYDFPAFALRPFNTYGRAPVNQDHFVIEKFITQMLKGTNVILAGSPNTVRDFVFREDHVRAYIMAIEKSIDNIDTLMGEVINISTGKGYTIKRVADIISDTIGWDGKIVWNHTIRPADIRKLIGDTKKSYRLLGWKAKYDIYNGIHRAVEEWKNVLWG